MPRKKFENSVDPGSTFTEVDSWWIGYPVKCNSCGTEHIFGEGDEVTERVQDGSHTLAYICEGGTPKRPCNNTIWCFENVVEDWKKQQMIDEAIAEVAK